MNHKTKTSLAGFAILLLTVAGATSVQAQQIFYVSPSGNDSWNGSMPERGVRNDGPFATLEVARDAIRDLKRRNALPAGATVYVREGLYELAEPLVLSPVDSGTAQAPITYANYPGETPLISGGRRISGWQPLGGNLWVTKIPEVAEGKWNFRQLFVNGQRGTLARSPNDGYYKIASVPDPATDGFWTPTRRFEYHEGDISPQWRNLQDVQVVTLFRWMDARLPIQDVDEQNHIVTFSKSSLSTYYSDARYFVENVFEALDAPGEWYLDRHSGELYYLAPKGEDPNMDIVVAPKLGEILRMEGNSESIHDIHVQGLTFAHNEWLSPQNPWTPPSEYTGDYQASSSVPGALIIHRGFNISIVNCTIENIGTYAIEIGLGSHGIRVVGNTIRHAGAGGIQIGREEGFEKLPRTDLSYDNEVTDNILHDLGETYPSAVGIMVIVGDNNRLSNNEISRMRYTGISVGFTWDTNPECASQGNIIEYNRVHDSGGRDLLSDLGGIYTLGVSPGTTVHNNFVHDMYDVNGFAVGIYLDAYSSNISVTNNVVYRTGGPSVYIAQGSGNSLRSNILAIPSVDRGPLITGGGAENDLVADNNILYFNGSKAVGGNLTGSNFKFDKNVYFNVTREPLLFGSFSFEDWQTQKGQDRGSLVADPLMVISEQGVSFDPSSPALLLGFEPIDLTSVGPRQNSAGLLPSFPLGVNGDVNGDGRVDATDIVYLINYQFQAGPEPSGSGDLNGDGFVNIADIFYLVNLVFVG